MPLREIKLRDRRNRLLRTHLEPLVAKWHWAESADQQRLDSARRDLLEFYSQARTLLPKTKIYRNFEPLAAGHGADYLRKLMMIGEELKKERWDNACHELHDMVHSICIQDRRVLYTIIGLVEMFL